MKMKMNTAQDDYNNDNDSIATVNRFLKLLIIKTKNESTCGTIKEKK